MSFYDTKSQLKRIKSIYESYTSYILSDAMTEEYNEKMNTQQLYEKFIHCYAFFSSEDTHAIKEANRVIESMFPLKFCHFSPVSIIEMLQFQKDKLTAENYSKLYEFMKGILHEYTVPELDFVGVNDNFPMIASYITIIGGQLFDDKNVYEKGVERLKQLPDLLRRRGSISEFNSPNYVLLEITALSLIAERVNDNEVREIALKCEERMWVEALGHAMPDLSHSAGPFSRFYTNGFTGSVDTTRALYILLGEKSVLYPNSKLGNPHVIETPFINHIPYCQFHCPSYLVEWYLDREYPHEYFSTFETNSSDDGLPHGKKRGWYFGAADPGERDPYTEDELHEYPAVTGDLVTYMEKNYSLGTSTKEWHNGLQCYSFFANYKKNDPVTHFSDMGCVFTKYIINDKLPWQPNEYEPYGMKEPGFNTWDMGRKMCLQHKNSAIVLYKPKAFASKQVENMRLGIFFPDINCEPLKEIWLGDKKVENYTANSKEPCSIFIDDGMVYMAIHPLTLTDYGRENAITIEHSDNGYIMISLYNYQGECRDFARRGFLLTTNGFAFEIRDKSEFSSFEEFRDGMSNFEIKDYLHTNAHVRQTYQRATEYKTPNLSLSMETTPISEGVRYQMVNGKPFNSRKLYVSGLDTAKLPYMED